MTKGRYPKVHLPKIFEIIKNYGRSRAGKSHSESVITLEVTLPQFLKVSVPDSL